MREFLTHKLQYYPKEISQILNKEIPNPIQCEITLTTGCNYKCPWCVFAYMSHSIQERLSIEKMRQVIKELGQLKVKSVVYAGSGEPFLYPEINEVLELTSREGIKQGVTTNGSLIKKEQAPIIVKTCDWIRFSITAISEELIGDVNGITKNYFDDIKSAIIELHKEREEKKSKLQIGVQSVLCYDNVTEYKKIISFCDENLVDYYMLRPFYPNPNNSSEVSSKFLLSSKRVNEIIKELGGVETKNTKVFLRKDTVRLMKKRTYTLCRGLPLVFVIEGDGRVFNCFPDRKGNDVSCIGNVNQDSLSNIWGGQKHKEFLFNIMPKLDKSLCQPYCRHHPMNEYLEQISNKPEGVEFP